MKKYPFMKFEDIQKYFDEMSRLGVSIVARSEDGFLEQYKRHGENLPPRWQKKRASFIDRTLKAFEMNPTYRRYLSLIAWSFKPDLENIFTPKRYFSGLSLEDKFKRLKEFEKRKSMAENENYEFQPMQTDKKVKTKRSNYVKMLDTLLDEFEIEKRDKKTLSEFFEIPEKILDEVYDRGIKAFYTSGSRPGATPYSWGYARMAKFILQYTGEIPKQTGYIDQDLYSKLETKKYKSGMDLDLMGKGLLKNIQEFFKGPRENYPSTVRQFLETRGNNFITNIQAVRRPINASKIANILSFGKYQQILKSKNYDEMFHLYLIVKLNNEERWAIEKNEVLNVYKNPLGQGQNIQSIPINLNNQSIKIIDLFENTRKRMGDNKFFSYNVKNNNCQIFIKNVLEANKLGKESDLNFILQDVKSVVESLPVFEKIINFSTDLSSRGNILIEGL